MGRRAMRADEVDPKGLMRESYRIEGIGAAECRSIFVDWALSLPAGLDPHDAIRTVLAEYGAGAPEHPMTKVLTAGLQPPGRAGGGSGRMSPVRAAR
jgi:hypothetical protein